MLQKTPINITFAQGLDLKTDPKQVKAGQFLALNNSVFTTSGRLSKRNGYGNITSLPTSAAATTLATLSGNLLATGTSLYAFSQDTNQWLNQGIIQPVQLSVTPLIRVSTSQSNPDTAVSASGLTCLVYMDSSLPYYQIYDSNTGQQIVQRTALPSTAISPRVFLFSGYFIITFTATVSAATHLQYIAIPITAPTSPSAAADLATTVKALSTGYDAYSTPAGLYYAWSRSSTVVDVAVLTLSNIALAQTPTPVAITGSHTADIMSVTVDPASPVSAGQSVVWVTFWDSSSTNVYSAARLGATLAAVMTATTVSTGVTLNTITSAASNGVNTVIYETSNEYGTPTSASTSVVTNFLSSAVITQPATVTTGTVAGPTVILRSVGLGSKAFISSGTVYCLAAYGELNVDITTPSPDQWTYFLIDSLGNIYMRLAYGNGGGYATTQVLPTASLSNGDYYIPYLYADYLTTVNKGTISGGGIPLSSIYTQYGVNLAKFSINSTGQQHSEIAGALHLTGGMLWEYDGVKPVEHGMHVWPDNVAITTATGSGGLVADTYYYQFCYEWTDNAGNLHRSAPSIPVKQVTTTSSSTNTIYVPTLRLTYKTGNNPVRIVGYRWSVLQQIYYQFTSVTSPVVNDPTIDYVTITDAAASTTLIGNAIIYTTGGVVENIAAPACIDSCLYGTRLFLIDAEDQNLLWYSKQVIEATPVEMSDLFTVYIAPTTGAQGSTGPMTALATMDDKLIIFKKDAIYYITGTGPDNTGASNDFSNPIFITSAVGSSNPDSIVLMPNGIMFQSDKGIWLLGRDLSTSYIGAPVESYNSSIVLSSQSIPGTNQVRFILPNNVTLMYDYFFNQWGTFSNQFGISSALYQGKDTYLNSYSQVYQETPGLYLDGSQPVLMSFTTSWITLAGIQGFERFYSMNLLGSYFTPFKLNVQLSYNYNPSPSQATLVTPDNYAPSWGGEASWGSGGPWGGSTDGNVFTARVFPQTQKCSSFQVTVNEIYDSSLGVSPGQGLNLSGLLLLIGAKRGSRTQSAQKSFG